MTRDIGAEFRALHRPGDPFVLVNAWDPGSAKVMAGLGAQAIGTTSVGHAMTLGRTDGGQVSRDEALAHAEAMVSAVNIPVSGDFENGFGADPDTCAETVRLAAEAGLAGISIEDTDFDAGGAYDAMLAAERIRAAAAAARALPRDFFLLARADGLFSRSYDLDEALSRISAFAKAGADGVYVPGIRKAAELQRVIEATEKPVNALPLGEMSKLSRAELGRMGVARISVGGALMAAVNKAAVDTGRAIISGDFLAMTQGLPWPEVHELMAGASDR